MTITGPIRKVSYILVLCFMQNVISQNDNKTSIEYKSLLQHTAKLLSKRLLEAVTTELGAGMNQINMPNNHRKNGYILDYLSDKIDLKINTSINILKDLKAIILNNTATASFTHPCPLNSLRRASYITSNLPNERDTARLNIQFNTIKERQSTSWLPLFKNLKVKRQYFLSKFDHATDMDCALTPQSNLRKLYHEIFHPYSKHILFVLDNSMSVSNMIKAVNIIRETVNILTGKDKISLVLADEMRYFKFLDVCNNLKNVYAGNATEDNKLILMEFLSNYNSTANFLKLNSSEELNNIIENEQALVIALNDFINQHRMVQVISNFLIVETISSLVMIVMENEIISHPMQNEEKMLTEGLRMNIIYVNDEVIPGQVATRALDTLPERRVVDEISIITVLPYWDPTQRDFIIPILLPLSNGLIGVDIYLTDLAEDIIYYKRLDLIERAFLMDHKTTVLVHSYFPRPELSKEKIKFRGIEFVENFEHIKFVKQHILKNSTGSLIIPMKHKQLKYSWRWIKQLYIVCVVTSNNEVIFENKSDNINYNLRSTRELLYHRLDLFPPKSGKICRHFKQISTLEQGTVYLSPSSFASPTSYLRDMSGQNATVTMQNYLAYLKGVAIQVLSNPGLKDEVRNDVIMLSSILTYFKKLHIHGAYSEYIIRRYAVTDNGVMVMYPGTILEYDYEPVRRPWYSATIENQGRIILTPPSLDVGGAGYIVTISYALPQSNNSHYIVEAMDVTMGFLYKLLINSFPHCTAPHMKCFIMTDRGNLISHPGLMNPKGPVEQQHITHKESRIVNIMLNQRGFVTKNLCNNFSDRTMQRYYKFNTSLPGVLTNMDYSEHSVHYYIAAIPGTNAFVGVVNATKNPGPFCPCSIVDRVCLNCNRMEQNECECPCECKYELDYCTAETSSNQTYNVPLCGPATESNHLKSHYFYNFAQNLRPCFELQCESYSNYASCLGVIGCEWCQLDTDAETPLTSPFCTSQSSCFRGVLGAVTPYGEGTYGRVTADENYNSYSAIGPVAGCAVTVCLIVAITIYCYKQNTSTASCRDLYHDGPIDNWPEQDLQFSRMQSDDMHDHSGQDRLLPTEPEAPISPYKILTSYRKPNTTGDSDHGYSTMTPHEDSEIMTFSLTEPIVSYDDSNQSDISCSVSTRMKPVTKQKTIDPSMTVLPATSCMNNIIAPVTVHRHMEAS